MFLYILLMVLFPIILTGIGEVIDEIDYYIDDYYYEENEVIEYDMCDYAYECKSYDKEYQVCLYDNEFNEQEKIMCKK